VTLDDINPDVLSDKLGVDEMRDIFGSMRTRLQRHQPDVYSKYFTHTDAEKRDLLAAWGARGGLVLHE
jgi:hypothetical protein